MPPEFWVLVFVVAVLMVWIGACAHMRSRHGESLRCPLCWGLSPKKTASLSKIVAEWRSHAR